MAKPSPPRTSDSQCILLRTRPVAVRAIRASMTISRKMRRGLFLIYFGSASMTQKKIVATTIAWLEGKEGSPEPFGRVFKMRNLSKMKYVASMRVMGTIMPMSSLSTFLRDLREIHSMRPSRPNTPSTAMVAIKITSVAVSHCID